MQCLQEKIGILTQAQNAKEKTDKASLIEQVQVDILGEQIKGNGSGITSGALQTILNKYFDDVIRSERDIEKAEEGLGIDFKVTKMELMTTNGKRKLLNMYYKIPEDMRDTIEKVTKTIGFNANSRFTAIFSFLAGRISKNQDTFFTGSGAGPGGNSERARHRRFTEEMGGSGHTHGHQDPHEHRDPHEQPTHGHDEPDQEDDGRDDR